MANFKQNLTKTPKPISGLTDGEDYLIQNLGGEPMGLSEEVDGATIQEIEEAALVVERREKISRGKKAGESHYIWNNSEKGKVSVAEAS